MLDNQDRTPQLVADAAYQGPESLGFALGHSCGRLVEQQQTRLGRDLRREIADPTHASGQFGGQRVGPRPETESVDDL